MMSSFDREMKLASALQRRLRLDEPDKHTEADQALLDESAREAETLVSVWERSQ